MKVFLACLIAAAVGSTATSSRQGGTPVTLTGTQLMALESLVTEEQMNHEHARIMLLRGEGDSVTVSLSYDEASGFGLLRPQRYSISIDGKVRPLD